MFLQEIKNARNQVVVMNMLYKNPEKIRDFYLKYSILSELEEVKLDNND